MTSPLDLVGLSSLMERSQGSPEIAVASIDGPVAPHHPDLASGSIRELPRRDLPGRERSAKPKVACSVADSVACMHGTFVAGMLSARRRRRSALAARCSCGRSLPKHRTATCKCRGRVRKNWRRPSSTAWMPASASSASAPPSSAVHRKAKASERTIAGLEKARKQGRIGGRPRLIENRDGLARPDAEGLTIAEIGEQLGISAASVCRVLKAHPIQRGVSQALV